MTRGATVTQPANEWLRFLFEVRELLHLIRSAERDAADLGPQVAQVTELQRAAWRAILTQATTLEDFMR